MSQLTLLAQNGNPTARTTTTPTQISAHVGPASAEPANRMAPALGAAGNGNADVGNNAGAKDTPKDPAPPSAVFNVPPADTGTGVPGDDTNTNTNTGSGTNSGSGSGSGAPTHAGTADPAATHFLAENFFGLDAGYWIIIAVSLSLSSVAIYFWNLADKAESNLRASEAELADAKRSLKKATGAQANQPSPLTRSVPAPAPAPQFKTPVEVERAVARLSSGLAGKLNIVNDVYRILQPHAAVVSRIPELDSRLQAAKKVLDSKDSPDKAAAAILAADALLAAPELASEGLLRELLQDALRAQRRKGGVSLEESRALAASLAAACATDFFVPEVGQPFDKNLHQAVGDSATSAFREPTIKRVVSGGLREPKTGHIGIRADVEIG